MRGRFYANIFVHFEPTGTLAYAPDTDLADIRLDEEGQRAIAQGLPPYFVLGSEWEGDWRSANPRGWEHHQVNVHTAANTANWEALKDVALHNIGALHEPDDNGWYPLHEAARGGHPEVAKFLLDAGADINKLTNQENGSSPLALARYYHGDDHPLVAFLKYHGALELEPEL